jgi:catechol 2,3-dioxygenase-like lactoylglutathione lyase family enzyme
MRFDHVILAVRDLQAARADFHELGFTSIYGGQHRGGLTHNALIAFADGSYLELMAPTDPAHLTARPGEGYLYVFQRGEGFAGYALHMQDLEASVAGMRLRGLPVGEPATGGRRRQDGQELAWRMATLPAGMSPFFLADVTPRELRVPARPEATTHANGALGAAGLVVLVGDLEQAKQRYRAILGQAPEPGSGMPGAATADFPVGGCRITLAAPEPSGGELAAELQRRGEGPYRLSLRIGSGEQAGLLDRTKTHGGEVALVGVG